MKCNGQNFPKGAIGSHSDRKPKLKQCQQPLPRLQLQPRVRGGRFVISDCCVFDNQEGIGSDIPMTVIVTNDLSLNCGRYLRMVAS